MLQKIFDRLTAGVMLPWVLGAAVIPGRRRSALIWGPKPILNNKYWSAAMREAGWDSRTVMDEVFTDINERADFDALFDDLVPRWILGGGLRASVAPYLAAVHWLRRAQVIHIPFTGGPLGGTPLWRLEAWLFRRAGIRIIVIPYGGDVYQPALVADPSVRHVLMLLDPSLGRHPRSRRARIEYWSAHADVIVVSFTIDGLPRWDVLVTNMVCIDTSSWDVPETRSTADGHHGTVRLSHAPNHRGAKGTEFILSAVEQLRREGLKIDLILAEGLPNKRVAALMQDVDVHLDQLIGPGYGLGAIEGMASGLPVVTALEPAAYTEVFRRFSFLAECPLVAAGPETVLEAIRALVTRPELRAELGAAGRAYVEKYHSYAATQHLFGSIYDHVLKGAEVDIRTLFHPLKDPYNRRTATVVHGLVESRIQRAE
jgi:glycosyltransferase involved in cell wall biosynthesis